MFPSDTAGWIGLGLALVVILPVAVVCLMLIIDNTKVLNEEKSLRAELDGIKREADRIGYDPTYEQVTALNARLDQYRQRFDAFRRSRFVISKPTQGRMTP